MNIPQTKGGVNRQAYAHTLRTPIRTYKPDNANVTACVTYHDPTLGIVAVTHRSSLGVMRASTAIHMDAGVFDRLEANGCQWLECLIKDTKTTYRTKIETMRQYGQLQRRFGLQYVLHLKYWGVNGDEPEAFKPAKQQPQAKPEAQQASLFDVPTVRKGGVY